MVSGFLWENTPGKLLTAAIEERIELASSFALISELTGVLRRTKFARRLAAQRLTPDVIVERYQLLCQLVTPANITPMVGTDPDDDQVLACALAANADLIVSGDKDLLNLKRYQNIQIVRAVQALAHIQNVNQA